MSSIGIVCPCFIDAIHPVRLVLIDLLVIQLLGNEAFSQGIFQRGGFIGIKIGADLTCVVLLLEAGHISSVFLLQR
ncbi:hypothetical protein D9M71_799190 [compost metagenome]